MTGLEAQGEPDRKTEDAMDRKFNKNEYEYKVNLKTKRERLKIV